MREVSKLHSEACRQIVQKYDKPFLTQQEYEMEIGKFSELAGMKHAINRQLKKIPI